MLPSPQGSPAPDLFAFAGGDLLSAILAETEAQAKAAPAPVVAPAPAPVVAPPAPVFHAAHVPGVTTRGRWTVLKGGVWGVKAPGASEGDIVTVVNSKGHVARIELGFEIRPGVFKKVGSQTTVKGRGRQSRPKRKVRRKCPGNNKCRTEGWQRGEFCR